MDNVICDLLTALIGQERSARLFKLVQVDPTLCQRRSHATQPDIAQTLNMLLFEDLLKRVPEADQYAKEQLAIGRQIFFDHGALRTLACDMEKLPSGKQAFARIFEALGYEENGRYPLDSLNMCGFVYTHRQFPEQIAQYFVSELYPERFSDQFQSAVHSLVYESRDPLSDTSKQSLQRLSEEGALDFESTRMLLQNLPTCFERQHSPPSIDQYRIFLAESAEMAWISTEGNAFNHATDRVDDLDKLEHEERSKGRPMKPVIEVGKHANIRQTAYRASVVQRPFTDGQHILERSVPGSFFEFIERGKVLDPDTGETRMDLRFDSRNAQGIFTMTR